MNVIYYAVAVRLNALQEREEHFQCLYYLDRQRFWSITEIGLMGSKYMSKDLFNALSLRRAKEYWSISVSVQGQTQVMHFFPCEVRIMLGKLTCRLILYLSCLWRVLLSLFRYHDTNLNLILLHVLNKVYLMRKREIIQFQQ